MCGISGVFNLRQPYRIDKTLLENINRLQSHRGPDDEGYFFDEYIGLAHRRLSIIDLAGGHQRYLTRISLLSSCLTARYITIWSWLMSWSGSATSFQHTVIPR